MTFRLWSGQLSAQILTGVMFIVIARTAGAGSLGRASACYGIAVAATQLVDLGAQRRLLRDAAAGGVRPEQLNSLLVAKTLLALAVSPVPVAAAAAVVHSPAAAAAAWMYAVVRARLMVAQALWQVEGHAGLSATVGAAERAFALLATIALLAAGASAPLAVAAGLLAGALLASVPTGAVYRRTAGVSRSGRGDVRGALRFGRHYGSVSIAANLLLLDTVLVTVLAGEVQAGFFGLGARLLGPLLVVTTSLSVALIPASARREVSLRRPLALVTLTTLAGIGTVVVAAPQLIRIAAGVEYAGAVPAVRVYAAASAVIALSQPIASWLQARGDERWVGRTIPASIVAGLVLVAIGAHVDGAVGAAAGQAVAVAVATVVLIRRATLVRRRGTHAARPVHRLVAP